MEKELLLQEVRFIDEELEVNVPGVVVVSCPDGDNLGRLVVGVTEESIREIIKGAEASPLDLLWLKSLELQAEGFDYIVEEIPEGIEYFVCVEEDSVHF